MNANGSATTATFQYGLTTAYGMTATFGTITGSNYSYVSMPVTGLTPTTIYHYRIAGTSSGGTSYGNDTTFTTADSIVCQAYFNFTSGPPPGYHTFSFHDYSSGNPAYWTWNFGDGGTSNVQNPDHTYATAGIYSVCLAITGPNCNSTFCRPVIITDSITIHSLYGHVYAGSSAIQCS